MKRFASLFEEVEQTTSTNAKVEALRRYFSSTPPQDAAWGLFFLLGHRLKRLVKAKQLHEWTLAFTQIPEWLLEESYGAVGDFAEVVALLAEARSDSTVAGEDRPLSEWISRLESLRGQPPEQQRERVLSFWSELPPRQLFLLNKLITGELRMGASATLVIRALGETAQLPPATVAHRLMGEWTPTAALFQSLLAKEGFQEAASRPYPFCLATPLEGSPEALGSSQEFLVEWKWDGIRTQLLRRAGETFIWSRGEELVTDRFPELAEPLASFPEGTVLDGEVMAWREGPLPFHLLQRRIGRQKLTPKILEEAPVSVVVYDLLEEGGVDLRALPIEERRRRLEEVLGGRPERFVLSPLLAPSAWEELAKLRGQSRDKRVEGLMLKRRGSPYFSGRKRGDWWKWKIDPYSMDAVLVYAQPGSGRRASLFTDLTFAVWDGPKLLPVAKAYSGLSDAEIAELDAWVRRHTVERFGPVRSVEPVQVFELAFEGILPSSRHQSGVAVRFPRIARWRHDKRADEADTLETVRGLLRV